ncbi:MAG: GntR family transcriptional regulator [Clostridiales bacterium]|nr:GntR family transcriptional regulator [Clostridiales bacterium]
MTPLNEQAYLHLRRMVRSDAFERGKIYSETGVSKELGISRTPVRDAIHRLSQEGYIDIVPSKGFMLHHLTKQDVIETFQIRSAIETFCARRICEETDTPKAKRFLGEMDEIMERMYQIMATTKSIEEFCKYDFDFHTELVDYLENEQLSSIYGLYVHRMINLAELSLKHEGRMDDTYEEHMAMMNGMKNGDVDHIYEIIMRHMDTPKAINLADLL